MALVTEMSASVWRHKLKVTVVFIADFVVLVNSGAVAHITSDKFSNWHNKDYFCTKVHAYG